jgi:hypothetical protein
VRFFRKNEQEEVERIVKIVQQAVVGDVSAEYVQGHEDSQRIRARHFEVWLPPAALLAGVVLQLNDESADVRKAAGAQLARDYGANPVVIGLVLDMLSEQSLPSLSADGRINALYFLNRSDAAAWTDDHRLLARNALARIRGRVKGGVAVGPPTARELDGLEKRLVADRTSVPDAPR